MNVRIPAPRRVFITSGMSARGGSTNASKPTRVSSLLTSFKMRPSVSVSGKVVPLFTIFRASKMTRLPSEDHLSLICRMDTLACSVKDPTAPSASTMVVQR